MNIITKDVAELAKEFSMSKYGTREMRDLALLQEIARLRAIPQPAAVPDELTPIPWHDVVKAIEAVNAEAWERGRMFPQDRGEHEADKEAARRVIGMIEWYAMNGGAVAMRLPGWPKYASDAPVPPSQEAKDAWVSVSDRLPGEQGHDSEEVLCFLNGHCGLTDFECRGGGGWGIRLGYYDAEKGMFRVFGRPEADVTHWMSLPTPPAIDAAMSARKDSSQVAADRPHISDIEHPMQHAAPDSPDMLAGAIASSLCVPAEQVAADLDAAQYHSHGDPGALEQGEPE